jgi:hypothetical protein
VPPVAATAEPTVNNAATTMASAVAKNCSPHKTLTPRLTTLDLTYLAEHPASVQPKVRDPNGRLISLNEPLNLSERWLKLFAALETIDRRKRRDLVQ